MYSLDINNLYSSENDSHKKRRKHYDMDSLLTQYLLNIKTPCNKVHSGFFLPKNTIQSLVATYVVWKTARILSATASSSGLSIRGEATARIQVQLSVGAGRAAASLARANHLTITRRFSTAVPRSITSSHDSREQ